MRRPKHPMPKTLIDLKFNNVKCMYEIIEDGITYSIQLEEVRLLREYFRHFTVGGGFLYPTVSRWYRDLDKLKRKLVIRTGNIPNVKEDFFPDVTYDL